MKSLESRLNTAVEDLGSGFGPALINLLLYGPIDKKIISTDNLVILKSREDIIQTAYQNLILPKRDKIITCLTDNSVKICKDKSKLSNKFQVEPFEKIREILKNSYNEDFYIDSLTINGLYGSEPLPKNDYVEFAKFGDVLVSQRFKKKDKLHQKYQIIKEKNRLSNNSILEFMVTVAENSLMFWNDIESYNVEFDKNYLSNNSNQRYTDLMLGDDLGLKIIDLNQTRSENSLEKLSQLGTNIKIPGFDLISQRYDDHRHREKSFRPGGLHYTLTDKGLQNFPIEVQVQGIYSAILDLFGENAHRIYTTRGKKLSV